MFFLKDLPSQQMIEGYAERFHINNVNSISKALLLMRQASLLVRHLDAYFASHNFSQLRFLILIVIDREPDRTSLYVNEIAERLDVSRPVMTRTLQQLVNNDLLSATQDNQDGRARKISLTKKGKKRLLGIIPGYFAVIDGFMKEHKF